VTIFADLGAEQPVDSIVVRLLGGGEQGGLVFPDEIRLLISPDGEDYYLVSERHRRGLDDLSPTAWDLPEESLAWVHNFRLPAGHRARYLAVQVVSRKQFVCADELAVVRGGDGLPAFEPDPAARVTIVTEGVAFSSHHAVHPICHNRPLRTKVAILDARSGAEYHGPCNLLIDLPDTVQLLTGGFDPVPARHGERTFNRYTIPCNRGKLAEFYLQSLLPAGETGMLYMYGDSGEGPQNEREITWQSIDIPTARSCKRLHVSLAWMAAANWHDDWPEGIRHMRELGFNAVGCFARYWKPEDVPGRQAALDEARAAGMKVIVNESPAGAVGGDRNQPERLSVINGEPGRGVCPSYRGQYYRREHASFAQHAVWARPDYIFYDIEAYWTGSQEAPRCDRCRQRFEQGGFIDWDQFRAAMGREIHQDMKAAVDGALTEAGIAQPITYGSYRTRPTTPLNDGLFAWANLHPDLLQIAMPSLYVAGDRMKVADNVSADRALLATNDIVPWLSTGTYGEYEPIRTRDMILEAFANGARGITYYYYGNFDPLHFKYHAEAIDIVAPIEDIFMDGTPIRGLACDHERIKLCGMAAGREMALLVSNYSGVAPGTKIAVTAPVQAPSQMWDLHSCQRVGEIAPGQTLQLTVDDAAAHMYYIGNAYASAIPR